jgi:hypothetical protein
MSVTRIMPRMYPSVRPIIVPTLLWYPCYLAMPIAFVVIETSWSFYDWLAFDTMIIIALRGNAGPKIFPMLPTNYFMMYLCHSMGRD